MRRDWDKKKLIEYESTLAKLFEAKQIKVPIHLSGGNEDQLIEIFKAIKEGDYVFSTHRNHYHYLLHGGDWYKLMCEIMGFNSACLCAGNSGSMHTIDHALKFYSSGIVAGCVAIAAGVALGIKIKKGKEKVWCFVGDGAVDSGWFQEAVKYATTKALPVTYVIEDNNRSCSTTIRERWGMHFNYPTNDKVIYYEYVPTYPHVGVGRFVTF